MSIADKLQTIAENERKVYDKGHADGQQSEYDRFWDSFQKKGVGTYNHYYISGLGWDDTTFKPKYDIKVGNWAQRFFYTTGRIDLCARLKECGVKLDLSACKNISYLAMDAAITTFPTLDVSQISSLNYFIHHCSSLKSIEKIILKNDGSQTFLNTTLGENSSLSHCIIEGCIGQSLNVSFSPLDLESAKSFILALKDYSGTSKEYTYKLSLSSTTKAYLEADGATAPDGNTWLDYAYNKGWNI